MDVQVPKEEKQLQVAEIMNALCEHQYWACIKYLMYKRVDSQRPYLMGFRNNLQMEIYSDNNYDRIDGINGRSQHSNNPHSVCHNIITLTTQDTIQ